MKNRVMISAVFACLLLLGWSAAQKDEQPQRVEASFVRTVGNGLVFVEIESDGTTSKFMLERAEIHNAGNQAFIVGTAVTRTGTGWSAGLRHWLPASNVTGMVELESKEDFAKRVKAARDRAGDAKRKAGDGDDDIPNLVDP